MSDPRLAFAQGLLQLLRLMRLYDSDNVNFEGPLASVAAAAEALGEADGVSLQAEGGVVYLDKTPLRGGRQAFNAIQALVKAFAELGIAEISFARPIEPATLRGVIDAMRSAEDGPALKAAVAANFEESARIFLPGEATGTAEIHTVEIDEETYFPLAYSRTLVLLREYVKNLRNEELARYFAQKLQRAGQELVGLSARFEHHILSLATVRGVDDFQFSHMVNTGLLSICLGRRLGLTNLQLSDLAYAAFVHGIGRFRTDPELVLKEVGTFERPERKEFGRHPYRSLAAFLEARQLSSRAQIAALVGFQFDLWRGYTRMRLPVFDAHPYSKIVAVCEFYDRCTTDLPGRPALTPDEAIEQICQRQPEETDDLDGSSRIDGGTKVGGTSRAGTSRLGRSRAGTTGFSSRRFAATGSQPRSSPLFDPIVVSAFGSMLGIFPSGTVVKLTTGEFAVVMHPNPELLRRPLVAVIRSAEGESVDPDYRDLAEQDLQGKFLAGIVDLVDAEAMGVEVPEELLA